MLEILVYYRIKGENVECNPAYTEFDRWSSSRKRGGLLNMTVKAGTG